MVRKREDGRRDDEREHQRTRDERCEDEREGLRDKRGVRMRG